MKHRTKITTRLAAVAGLALTAASANAAVTFTGAGTDAEASSSTLGAYAGDVSSSDLINGLTPTTTGWNTSNQASPLELTDGIHGVGFGVVSGDNVQGAWTTVGATATYALGVGANSKGYDITSMLSIADWENANFGNQAWTVDVRELGGSFSLLATVDYQPVADSGNPGATKVTLSGLDATAIDAIRFTADSVNGGATAGAFIWRELDVFGVATVPEPSSAALLGLGGLALILRRRRG